jgi:hypothetical protein
MFGKAVRAIIAGTALLAAPIAARAEITPPSVPSLAASEAEWGDERKYVYFHKPGVSFADALRDISECARHARRTAQRTAPAFVPWGRDDRGSPVTYEGLNYGLVGAAIGAIIAGPLERSARQTVMIRCLTPMGYSRYRAGKDQWQAIFEGDGDWVPVAAAIASGPVPPTPRVD